MPGPSAIDEYLDAEAAGAAPDGIFDTVTEDDLHQQKLSSQVAHDVAAYKARIGTATAEDYSLLNHGLSALPHIDNDA